MDEDYEDFHRAKFCKKTLVHNILRHQESTAKGPTN